MKALIVLSGGQDSTTCLFLAKQHGHELHAITFDYNQRHRREIEAALHVGRLAGVVTHKVVELGPVLEGTSPLVSQHNLEQYRDMHSLPGGVEKTFVPMRNQLFLTIAMNRAVVLGCGAIYTGVSEEDYGGYPDCRHEFIRAFQDASARGLGEAVAQAPHIATPLISLNKKETVQLARQLDGCWEALAYTHTSYDGAYPPTGQDHATLLRAKGFFEANEPDPLVLRAFREGLMPLPNAANYDRYRLDNGLEV